MASLNKTANPPAGTVPWRARLRTTNYRIGIAVCLLFVARALLVIPLNLPFIFPDEVGYLANVRHIVGRGNLAMLDTTYYNAGYSLLLLPSQLLGSPEAGYRYALLINCLLAALLFAVLYSAIRSLSGVSANEALVISTAACLYPAGSFWACSSMSESTCALILPLAVLTLARFLERLKPLDGVWFCTVAAFGFAVHGRFAALPLLAVLVLFALRMLRRISWTHTWFLLAILASMVAAIAILNRHLGAAMWGSGAATPQVIVSDGWSQIQKPGGLQRLANFAMGQVSYIALATYGLAPIALAFLTLQVRWSHRRSGKIAQSRMLFLFLLLAVFSIGAVVLIVLMFAFRFEPRSGTFAILYGRYEDAAAPLLIAIGLAAYAPSIRRTIAVIKVKRMRILCVIGSMLVPAVILLSFAPDISSGLGFHETVSINHLAVLRDPFSFGFAVMVVAIAFIGLDVFWRRRLWLGVAMMAVAFLAPAVINYRARLLAQKFDQTDAAGILNPLRSRNEPKRMAVDKALEFPLVFLLKYLLPDTKVVMFDASKHEQPGETLVLAPLAWGPKEDRDARIAGSSAWNANDRYPVLWLRNTDPYYATYQDRIFPDLPMFGSYMQGNTGRIRGLSRLATPADSVDFLVRGQKIPLPEGSYNLETHYSVSGLRPGQSAADWDVVLAAKTTLAAGQLSENGQGRILRCKFGVAPEMAGGLWEFRVMHKGVATVRIDSAVLRRSGPYRGK